MTARYPPIWRQSHPADEVLSSAQNWVIGAATTHTHADVRALRARISMHVLEYSPTLLDPAEDYRAAFSIILIGNQIAESGARDEGLAVTALGVHIVRFGVGDGGAPGRGQLRRG
jgi:hypothetical protein